MNRTLFVLVGLLAWTALVFFVAWSWRGSRGEVAASGRIAAMATAEVAQVNETRGIEHTQADTMATIGAKHEEDRAAAETVPAAVVAELRAGTVRLRHDLATCHTGRLSEAAAGAVQRDAPADLGVTVAGPVIGIGRDADDQLRACQAVIAADRAEVRP